MTCQPKASHHVNGAFLDDTTGDALPVLHPATGAEIAHLHAATPAILDHALTAAADAQPAWAALSGTERGRILRRAADIIRDRNEELSRLETWDTGKPIQETREADAASGADALEYFGGLAATLTGEHIPLGADWAYTRREALGVCVGLGAWNYPTQIACWKAAPALACGNTMVFKPSEETPLGALALADIFREAGLPAGVFNVVQGRGTVGAALATDARVAKVSLTGSVPTGRKVYAAAAEGLKHATLELGGKSPLIVFDDANLDDAVGGALLGNMYSAGQICSNGTRVFVQRGILDAFLNQAKARIEMIRLGDPHDDTTQMGPLISAAQRDKVAALVATGTAEGARLITGGTALRGNFFAPTLFADVTDDMTIARDEIFGPVMSVLAFDTEEDVTTRANATPFGLAAGVFTQDITRAHRMVANLQAGTCWINTYNLTPVEMPFGGVKASGLGRENAKAAIDHYTQIKSVYVATGPLEAPY
ncbi:MAG: betaine-aldehyde dehydrogenase [Pseudomonadota bacterium]